MIEGVIIFLVGTGFGRILRLRRSGPKPKVIKPICGCGHHLALHDQDGCHDTVDVAIKWRTDSYNVTTALAWRYEPCPCRKYVLKDDPFAGALGP